MKPNGEAPLPLGANQPGLGKGGSRDAVRRLRTPIGLVGVGVEGLATLAYLKSHGVTDLRLFDRGLAQRVTRVAVTGEEPPPPEIAGLPLFGDEAWARELPRCGTVFRSPGIRPDHPALAAARASGVMVTSATDWFLRHCPAPVIGVTGTVGKGTAATLIHMALRSAGIPSRLGGNIGVNPLAFLDELRADEPVVLELSSFQLMDLGPVKPAVAVVLRTSEDHLDWHPSLAEYYEAKAGLLAPGRWLLSGPRQVVIYCADAPGSRAVVGHALGQSRPSLEGFGALAVSRAGPVPDGIGVLDRQVLRFRPGTPPPPPQRLEALEELTLPGQFNLENAAAAFLAAEALGADPDKALAAIARFPGLPHRLERVGLVVRGEHRVACYNDSYATRPDATLAALSAFDQPLALILGGSEKNADFRALAEAVCRHPNVRCVLLIGATAERLRGEIVAAAQRLGTAAPACTLHPGLPEAFHAGLAALTEGGGGAQGVLLMSPACASFGLFPNYKVRGERFKALVQQAQGA